MIATRDEFLSAVRRAELTPQGIRIGPVEFLDGKDLLLGKVRTEEVRRELINKVRMAASRFFAPGARWEMPSHVRKKQSSKGRKGRR